MPKLCHNDSWKVKIDFDAARSLINPGFPDGSKLFTRAQGIDHGGKGAVKWEEGSPGYEALKKWIEEFPLPKTIIETPEEIF